MWFPSLLSDDAPLVSPSDDDRFVPIMGRTGAGGEEGGEEGVCSSGVRGVATGGERGANDGVSDDGAL